MAREEDAVPEQNVEGAASEKIRGVNIEEVARKLWARREGQAKGFRTVPLRRGLAE